MNIENQCNHEYITSTSALGWHCTRCGVQLLSLSVPIPLPLIERALAVIGREVKQ